MNPYQTSLNSQNAGERDGAKVDGTCRSMTASYVRSRHEDRALCDYFNVWMISVPLMRQGFEFVGRATPLEPGVYSLASKQSYLISSSWIEGDISHCRMT